MLGLPWWSWLFLVVVGLVLLFRAAVRSHRRGVRAQFVAFLRERHPEWEILAEGDQALEVRRDGTDGVLNLHNLFRAIALAKANTPAERRELFDRFLTATEEHRERAGRDLSLELDGPLVLPRLERAGLPASLAEETGAPIPHTLLPELGLCAVYVIDGKESVMWITEPLREQLGLDVAALHALALDNLAQKFAPELVERARGGSVVMVKALDTFDAARLLVVPRFLREGEELAAVIPDRDTLALVTVPAGGDWSLPQKLARARAGEPLLDRPVRVTAAGFELR